MNNGCYIYNVNDSNEFHCKQIQIDFEKETVRDITLLRLSRYYFDIKVNNNQVEYYTGMYSVNFYEDTGKRETWLPFLKLDQITILKSWIEFCNKNKDKYKEKLITLNEALLYQQRLKKQKTLKNKFYFVTIISVIYSIIMICLER